MRGGDAIIKVAPRGWKGIYHEVAGFLGKIVPGQRGGVEPGWQVREPEKHQSSDKPGKIPRG